MSISVAMTTPEQTQTAAHPTRDRDIYDNFATPLAGTFLNLPQHGVVLKCPACGVKGESVLQHDLKWWASELNRIVGCLFVCVLNFLPAVAAGVGCELG